MRMSDGDGEVRRVGEAVVRQSLAVVERWLLLGPGRQPKMTYLDAAGRFQHCRCTVQQEVLKEWA